MAGDQLYFASPDSPYLWMDGSKVVYTNWAPGEPNDKSGTENCVEVYIESGQWNDHACTEFVSYVCKMPKGKTLRMDSSTSDSPPM